MIIKSSLNLDWRSFRQQSVLVKAKAQVRVMEKCPSLYGDLKVEIGVNWLVASNILTSGLFPLLSSEAAWWEPLRML